MKQLLGLLALLPFLVQAQGINFEKSLSWSQVKEKAKAENKYIFMDVFATWCGPCKMMERDVYPAEKVGTFFNNHFISVKVQMDTTAHDNEQVKSWYADAEAIKKAYPIDAFPSYLFFSPDGKLVHRDLGYKKPDDFVDLAKIAVNPERQTYTIYNSLLNEFKEGKLAPEKKLQLATTARKLKEKQTAEKVAKDYKESYLDKLNWEDLTKEQLSFIGDFSRLITSEGSKGRYFDIFYKHGAEIDKKIQHEGFAAWFVKAVITKEEMEDKLWKDGKPVTQKPDWNKLKSTIVKKYGAQYGDLTGSTAQMNFYKRTKNGAAYAKVVDGMIKQYPPTAGGKSLSKAIGGIAGFGTDAWGLNVAAWDLFEFSDDKVALNRALAWADLAIKLDGKDPTRPKNGEGLENVNLQIVDTKANILYKLGRIDEGIALEQKAVEIDEAGAKKRGQNNYVSGFAEYLKKMKDRKPTWPVK